MTQSIRRQIMSIMADGRYRTIEDMRKTLSATTTLPPSAAAIRTMVRRLAAERWLRSETKASITMYVATDFTT